MVDTGWQIVIILTVVLSSFVGNHYVHQYHIGWIPEGGVAILIGLMVGGIDYWAEGSLSNVVTFNPELFIEVLLPIIIFDAGYSLKKKGLFNNLGTILMYAVLGTLVSTAIIGFGIWGFSRVIDGLEADSATESLMFGALISAVDPVASLAVFASVFRIDERKTTPLLYNLVFGESVLNDAVSIVLFKSLATFLTEPYQGARSVFKIIGKFFGVSLASLLIGVACGLFTAMIFKYTKMRRNNTFEIFFVFGISYASFLMAEEANVSGIVAIFFCGITQSHYTWYNQSRFGQILLPKVYHAMAYTAETVVFAYLGMAVFAFMETSHDWRTGLVFLSLMLCLVGRAAAVFPLTAIVNIFRKNKITAKEQGIIWFSGLRGAIAFSLALEMTEIEREDHSTGAITHGTPNSGAIVTVTLFIILVTTFVCGILTGPLLKWMNFDLSIKSEESKAAFEKRESTLRKPTRKTRKFVQWDRKYMKRFFVRSDAAEAMDSRWEQEKYLTSIFTSPMHVFEEARKSTQLDEKGEDHSTGKHRAIYVPSDVHDMSEGYPRRAMIGGNYDGDDDDDSRSDAPLAHSNVELNEVRVSTTNSNPLSALTPKPNGK